MNKTMITAHSGCEGTPDNSMASVEAAIRVGADCTEVDVHLDGEGKLWLIHDTPVTYEGLVSLDEALTPILESGIGVNCDLKHSEALYPTLALAEGRGLPRAQLFLSGSVPVQMLLDDPEIVRRARVLLNIECLLEYMMPDFARNWQSSFDFAAAHLDELCALIKKLGVEAVNAPYKYFPAALREAMEAQGIAFSLWTINDESRLPEYLSKNLLNITTRIPSAALRLRDGK